MPEPLSLPLGVDIDTLPPGKAVDSDQDLLRRGLPPALAKACEDPFDYAVGLRDGRVVRFQQATYFDNGWLRLEGIAYVCPAFASEHCFARGLEVRLRDVLWAADAPDGS